MTIKEKIEWIVYTRIHELPDSVGLDYGDCVDALESLISYSNQQAVEEGIKMVKLPEYDHSKCVMKETCIGYMNAVSDLDNEKRILLDSLKGDK